MAKKKTAEEIADDNERTNAVGLFNYADSYLCCAKHPNASPSLHLRFDAPIDFLLFHAAELYLKSYLRQKGEDLEAVKRLGHFHPQICAKAAAFGMSLPAEIEEIFELADKTDAVIESRYLRTGPKQRIETTALLTAVEEVRAKVKVSHEAAGVILAATRALP
jgi:HEPN domain-containing protein